ncbi:MAG: tetratricopeptide repeat protein [Pseudomonadota bacterium]
MSDVFEEVEEGYRRDRAAEIWKRVGPFVWIAAGLLIGGVAWFEYNKIQVAKAQFESIQILEAARESLEEGDYAAAQAGFRELASTDAEVSALAQHYLANALFEGGGDAAAASEQLNNVAGNDAPLAKLARLKAAYLTADDMDLAALETALQGLHTEDGPLGVLALELVAAKAFAEGDLKRAREEFSYLRLAANAPQGVTQRAELALSVIPFISADEEDMPEQPAEEIVSEPVEEDGQ